MPLRTNAPQNKCPTEKNKADHKGRPYILDYSAKV